MSVASTAAARLHILQLLATMLVLVSANIALPNCTSRCGNISIPYPFGLSAGCHREGFELTCNETYHPPKLFMNSSGVEVLEISSQDSTLYIDSGILTLAGDEGPDGFIRMNWSVPLNDSLYRTAGNTMIVLGCGITFRVQWPSAQSWPYLGEESPSSSCPLKCMPPHPVIATDGICLHDNGCCTTGTRYDSNRFLITYSVYEENLPLLNSSVALVEWEWLSKKKNVMILQKAASSDTSLGASKGVLHPIPGVPIRTAISWVFSNLSCAEASNSSDFGCLSDNSKCLLYLTPNDAIGGHTCQCWHGYQGNPYVQHGCQGFAPALGIGSGLGTLLIILSALIARRKLLVWKARKSREFFFKKNRGLLLQRLVDKDIAERMLFSLQELEKATNKFDEARKLGGGGHGTVYKGILSDKHVVAIKKSKVVIQRETDDFINEVAILSQVNHRNVVKLFGCCLETEVPLLVYEFISNGTLSDHLHAGTPLSMPWKDRLRIAIETSRCLAYLHSAASVSIVHRDVKSANILLDDRVTAKVSDFGASRGIPIGQTGVTTAVQGTFGYLDPEYYHTRRLTEKSDVYSFGVMLVELLTRKKPCVDLSTPGASLIAEFILRVNQDKICEMLDQQVIEEGTEEAKQVAAVALMCLSLKGEDRPTMRQVETKLEVIQTVERNTPVEQTNANADDDNFSRRYSMEEECMSSMSFPR
ncbi:wall-associated receptor kinase-like 8 [Triticum aestivum]|uniref:wall-associated receptor kinase-like 8 n=1 Tax=Triticum aestivum TaxID=4565 RepID=UPI001D0078DB|nr:wall-associated receptor kinase-like 8 [Triticum aestivum]